MVPITHFLYLATGLFAIGAAGVLLRRNALMVLMSLELMLTGVNLALVTFSRAWGNHEGQIFAFFCIAVAAAEAAIGLALVVALFRGRRVSANLDDLRLLRD